MRSALHDWRTRRVIIAWRLKTLAAGDDPAGAFLLIHHLSWLLVLAIPGQTITANAHGRSSFEIFLHFGGDQAVAAVYAILLVLTTIAVLRLSLSTRTLRGCMLAVLSISAGLAVTYIVSRPEGIVSWDAALRALLAWWAYTALDPDER